MNKWIRTIGLLHLPLGFIFLYISFNVITNPYWQVWFTCIFGGYSFLIGVSVMLDTLEMIG